jgi:hypothetical protein
MQKRQMLFAPLSKAKSVQCNKHATIRNSTRVLIKFSLSSSTQELLSPRAVVKLSR